MKALILGLILFFPLLSFCQIDSSLTFQKKESRFKTAGNLLKNEFKIVPEDFKLMGNTLSKNWKRTGLFAGGILSLVAADKITTGFLHHSIEPKLQYSLPNITFINSPLNWTEGNNSYIFYPILGLYASSLALNYSKGQRIALHASKSVVYSFLISHVILKTLFARNRPQRPVGDSSPAIEPWTKNPWDFGNFHRPYFNSQIGGTAFPSFHASFYFAVAKVFQMEFHNYWIPYGFVAGVFLAEIKDHNHWVSDIVFGGIIGTIIGHSIVKSSSQSINDLINSRKPGFLKKKDLKLQLIPTISFNQIGIHVRANF